MLTIEMAKLSDFQYPAILIPYLARQLKKGRLVLVVGAGISEAFGLPGWEKLLIRLYAKRGATRNTGLDLKRQARDFRIEFFGNDKDAFIQEVKSVLYDGVKVDFEELRKSKTLSSIGALVMASHRGNASTVVTFNWDNLLELYLEYHGFETLSAHEEIHWSGNVDVTILHPHGFIPFDPSTKGSRDIIFDQTSYSEVIGKEQKPWRQEILSIFRSHTVIFIGLSGTDDNLDSFLQTAKTEHASLSNQSAFWGITLGVLKDESERRAWQDNGVFYFQVADYDNALPDVLFQICQQAVHS